MDFLRIASKETRRGVEIYPNFIVKTSDDLMIRGGDFYAVWVEDRNLWSTNEQDAINLIDRELDKYVEANKNRFEGRINVLHMWDSDSGMIDKWHKYCKQQLWDNFHMLDEELIFANSVVSKESYASKRLNYPLEEGDISAYNRLMSTLYTEEERAKIEWAIGAIVAGDSKLIQKFLVLYGSAGTGKSTILNIVQMLFEGYYSVFDAKALGSASNSFALEAFKSNPLVAIQHDGDLSRIEDNTRLNSLVSHELMTVNEKFKSTYSNRFKSFLFMGTNKPVKITDAKSGLIRRLIDVSPSGNKLPYIEYSKLMAQIPFELGGIAYHCKEFYKENAEKYNDYIPTTMLDASNDFYNFVMDSYHVFLKEDGTTLKSAWERYKIYCDDAKVNYTMSQRSFKEELKNYFKEYLERANLEDGTRVRSYYKGFRTDKFVVNKEPETKKLDSWIKLEDCEDSQSVFTQYCGDFPAQYATSSGIPKEKWDEVKTSLCEINTNELHYVKLPINHIVIDFDIKDKNGEKSLESNIAAASKWKETYAEVSKSGNGLHLHYLYTGDISKLSRIYDDSIEIKIFNGNSSLRRKLTKCNRLPIATLSSGLPLKGADKVVDYNVLNNEKGLRVLIKKSLSREIHPNTKPSIDFIYKILDDAYNNDVPYDVSDMYDDILHFAMGSSHQSDYCIKKVAQMNFKSEEFTDNYDKSNAPIVFYDVEIFPNLFLVNWKYAGENQNVVRMINPTSSEIEELLKFRLIGFNCRRYDNHMLYARLLGYTNKQLYDLSQKIIQKAPNCFFGEAYNLSYTDVLDFSSKKQTLKLFEIELGIHHKELGLPWDQPVPEELWEEVAKYCDNDVIATEAVFNARQSDFLAREILADVAGMTVNDTTNTLTTRIIFGKNKTPQDQFNYRDMGDISKGTEKWTITDGLVFYSGDDVDEYSVFDDVGRPVFPGYKFELGVSTYRGEKVGEGGYVYAEPGMYTRVALLDIASMHPSSIIAEELFGPLYTKRFEEIVKARIAIKHKDFDTAKKMLDGALAKYLTDEESASGLAGALKIAINSVYGLTMAKHNTPFRDSRNVDNIVAKRGALFMINLKHEVQKRGYTVAHIKTDSIKIPDADQKIIDFVMEYGERYGYTFEHEATYEKMCLVNDAVYIAKYEDGEWTATGAQFAIPYTFKTLFSGEPIEFNDLCCTKSASTAIYLDMNESLDDVSKLEKELYVIKKGDREHERQKELAEIIAANHDYQFVGRVGNFCPVKKGCGGGELVRIGTDIFGDTKYDAVAGTKGYRWIESELIKDLDYDELVDIRYHEELADKAIEEISKYGDFDAFVRDDYVQKAIEADLPWYTDDELDDFKKR